MGSYVPQTEAERQEMLAAVGLKSMDDLFGAIPAEVRIDELGLPEGLSALEVEQRLADLAAKNTVFGSIFRGAGAYHHYIPVLARQIPAKESFLTSYTPYQAEVSQGVLQAIFEYQTMIAELTGLPVANASLYDGATAAAEAVAMCRDRKRTKTLVSATVDPQTIATIATYAHGHGSEVELIGSVDGVTDLDALARLLAGDDTIASVLIQQPNFYGRIEPADEIGRMLATSKAMYIMSVNPIAAAILRTPGECGADIACGEGQPLGMPLSFGGPYLGFLSCTDKLMRKIPGRIAGQTVDADGRRAFVLTLQTREQHIRREKATSNICSNQALCALTASVYLATMGPQGLRDVATQCLSKAAYARDRICELDGFDQVYPGSMFHEFVTTTPVAADVLERQLAEQGILSGLPIAEGILWCVTEMNTKAGIDALVEALRSVSQGGR